VIGCPSPSSSPTTASSARRPANSPTPHGARTRRRSTGWSSPTGIGRTPRSPRSPSRPGHAGAARWSPRYSGP
jgi:hypothetical protein